MKRILVVLALLLAACNSSKPEAASNGAEARVIAKADADVDAALAEARKAPVLPVASPPVAEDTNTP